MSQVTSHEYSFRRTADDRASKAIGSVTHYPNSVEMVDKPRRVYGKYDRKKPNMSTIDADSDSDTAPDGSSHTSQEQIIRQPAELHGTNVDLENGDRWDPNGITVETSYEVRPDTAPQELSPTVQNTIYMGPDQQPNIHGNRIDIFSHERSGTTF